MNRTIKDATTKAFHYPDLDALKTHVLAFVTAYNFAKHLKALRWRTPFQAVFTPGPNTPPPSESTRTTSSRDRTSSHLAVLGGNYGSWPGSDGYLRDG
jgi:hypothetical protein